MKYPRLMHQVASMQWAITPEALDGIFKAVDQGLSGDDRLLFHKAGDGALDVFDESSESREPFVRGSEGYLFIDGPIIPRDSSFSRSSGLTSIQTLTRGFRQLAGDGRVSRINLIVDSPGGSVTGVSEFAQMISESEKPTRAYNVGQMASAAYWISASADEVYSSDTGIVGSIGVLHWPGRFDPDAVVSSQSPNKMLDASTSEGRRVIQSRVDDMAEVMVSWIAGHRGVSRDAVVNDFGRGGVMLASRAKEVGMIDKISTLEAFLSDSLEGPNRGSTADTSITQETTMSDKATAPALDVEAIKKEAAMAAIQAERTRLQGIEAVKKQFKGEDSRVRDAATAAVDKVKFDPEATPESALSAAYAAAFSAQKQLVTEAASPRRELAEVMAKVPSEPKQDPADDGVNKSRVAAMRAGFLGGK